MTPAAYEIALVAWVREALGLAQAKVGLAGQAANLPAEPHALVRVVAPPQPVGRADTTLTATTTDGGFVRKIRQVLEGTVSVDLCGEDHVAMVQRLRFAPQIPELRAFAAERGLVVAEVVGGINGSQLDDAAWRRRSILDFRFRIAEGAEEAVPALATVTPTLDVE